MTTTFTSGAVRLALAFLMGFGVSAAASPPALKLGVSVELGGRPLQQVAITTTDLDRSIGFYRDDLGVPLLFVANRMAFFDVGGTRLMIALDSARTAQPSSSILYFDAPRFNEQLARLKQTRASLVGGVEVVDRRDDRQLALQQFTDLDGNALAIMGWMPRQ